MRTCDSILISCIDFRLQKYIETFANKKLGVKNYDHVSLAGGVFDFYTVLKQVEISNRLHSIKNVVLVNHEDCGAYGREGSFKRHKTDLMEAERKIEALFPHLDVAIYYLKLNGEFVNLSQTNKEEK